MKNKGIFCLTLNLCFYRIFTRLPNLFFADNGYGTPLSALISALISLTLISLLLCLYQKCGCRNIIQLCQRLTGAFGAKVLGIILILFTLVCSSFALRDFVLLSALIAYPSTPLFFIALFLILPPLTGAYQGKGLLSLHTLTVPIIFVITLFILASALFRGGSMGFFPVLGNGIGSIFTHSLHSLLLFSDIVLLFMQNPFDEDDQSSRRSVFIASVLGILTVLMTVITFTAISVFPQAEQVLFPIYKIVKTVWTGRFFQRLDGIFLIISSFSVMLYLLFTLRLITNTAEDIFPCCRVSKIALCSSALVIFICGTGRTFLSDFWLMRGLMLLSIIAVAIAFIIFLIAFLKGVAEK